ncbi:hypothetical protein BDK51DRAFT_30795 [Blyttiomyces helicus]|uniref:Uncharacterized protein n=1 Tax=Blyttiomyces helicus TaxID=388810 RepID=A0A4P9WNR4_9FUNG|nr:hypothetical protein BDK51DRAFT_30795 [Blyttiomyces helicus]|eukprot:RKO92840.1 hypothetical protein BDK51DRAFT_30795 [Blyttiomyces helicus]
MPVLSSSSCDQIGWSLAWLWSWLQHLTEATVLSKSVHWPSLERGTRIRQHLVGVTGCIGKLVEDCIFYQASQIQLRSGAMDNQQPCSSRAAGAKRKGFSVRNILTAG